MALSIVLLLVDDRSLLIKKHLHIFCDLYPLLDFIRSLYTSYRALLSFLCVLVFFHSFLECSHSPRLLPQLSPVCSSHSRGYFNHIHGFNYHVYAIFLALNSALNSRNIIQLVPGNLTFRSYRNFELHMVWKCPSDFHLKSISQLWNSWWKSCHSWKLET